MKGKPIGGKRKATAFVEEKKKIVEEQQKSDSDSEGEEIVLNGIENDENDTTDDEGVGELYTSDDDDELSFISDEEGNFQHVNKVSDESGEGSEIGDEKATETDLDEEEGQDDESEEAEENESEDDEEDTDQEQEAEEVIPQKVEEKKETNDKKQKSPKPKKSKALKEFQNEIKRADGAGTSKGYNEYEDVDTSDEEDIRNTVGNIPLHWYDEYKHIGYDWDAKKIIKPPQADQIDDFLKKIEDPNFWRTVKDPQTGQQVVLSDADIELIKRINAGRIPNSDYNQYEPWVDWFTSEVEKMPVRNIPEHKRSFLPSQGDKKMISRMVHALKMGWMKTTRELKRERQQQKGPKFYMLWETDTDREEMRRIHDHVAPPKRDLPGHAESYNPPPEYLFDEREMKEWNKLKDEPHKRKLHFLPQKYKSLREVPAYPRYARERFLRCLDLYLCPRARRMKLTIDADYLVPKLPSPRDLQPFPTIESLVYRGHTDLVRSVSVEPKGEYLLSGSDDMTVKIWEISTGRCLRTIETGDIVRCVAWCPNVKLSLIAVASGNRVLLINTKVGDKVLVKKTDDLLAEAPPSDVIENERIKTAVQWTTPNKKEYEDGVRIVLAHFKPVRQVTWHGRGDYFATCMPDGANRSALIHQLSKRRTQIPFSKSKGLVQCVLFHPIKPCFFVATQHNIRIYDLVKQELIKKLLTASKWISNMAIHPKGDNLLVSTYDKKMLWFDLDLSTKPYQTMRLHKNAVRCVAYHLRYPLFASGSDDRAIIVSHGMVYNDLLQNPLIVPLKKLETHETRQEFGVLDVVWHPMQPWVFSSGADTTIRLYT